MKSRTSYFNATAFKKDITRFAPAWVLYTVMLLLALVSLLGNNNQLYRAEQVVELIAVGAIAAFCFALINAQLLFGDLCSSRMCNALHAMPLRRESWFGSHITAGILFFLLPNLLISLLGVAVLTLGKGWSLPLWWALAVSIQYLFFFGLAVLCMMIVGNRFAQVLLYGILNFFSLLLYWLVDSLYEPLLYGIRVPGDSFYTWCPVVKMTGSLDLIQVIRLNTMDDSGNLVSRTIDRIAIGGDWGYLLLCGALGIGMLALALALYRRRKLERAGDFIAFGFMEPVFLILYTICVGAFAHLVSALFGDVDYLFLVIGTAVGFFTGLMLLRRTTRVFSRKALLQFTAFAAVFMLTLAVTWLDPLRLTQKVPAPDQIESVTLSNSSELTTYPGRSLTVTQPDQIQDMVDVHLDCLKGGEAYSHGESSDNFVAIWLEYTLRDGSTLNRFYTLDTDCPAGQTLKGYFSSPEMVLGFSESQIPEMADRIRSVYFQTRREFSSDPHELGIDTEEMLRAIAADCREGHMTQIYSYRGNVANVERSYLEFDLKLDNGRYDYVYLSVYEDAVHTLEWLDQHDFLDENQPLY